MKDLICFQSSALQGLRHGFFGRCGGVSEGLVGSLNCYPYIKEKTQQIDEISNVNKNRHIILERLNIHASDVVTANQVHGDNIVRVNSIMPMDFAEADGMITTMPNVPLGILTADCVPVLYADTNHTIIGAAHAGWKGALLDIHLKMIKKFNSLGVAASNIKVAIGPSIQQASYEVDKAFYNQFISKDPRSDMYFMKGNREGYYQFDSCRRIYEDLMNAGVHSVDWVRLDTAVHETLFFSHRRAVLSGTQITGRQLSVICL